MADFRKCVYAFAVLALVLGSAVTANAQAVPSFQCIANAATPALLRAEGLTELTGDVTLNCTGVPFGWPVVANVPTVAPSGVVPPAGIVPPTVNIQVFLNTNVTSRLLSDPWTEALLLIDDPAPADIRVCAGGTVFNASVTGPPTQQCNAFQGRIAPGLNNSILFLGVPVLPPGSAGTRVYRITNIRANASTLNPGSSGAPGQVQTLISATPATSGCSNALNTATPPGPGYICPTVGAAPISPGFTINNPQQISGFVQPGLAVALRTASGGDTLSSSFGFQQCINRTTGSSSSTGRPVSGFARLRYTENFATAFRTRTAAQPVPPDLYSTPAPVPQASPGTIYNSESGYYNPLLAGNIIAGSGGNLSVAGLADHGTRLKATFTNVPAGVRLFVSVTEVDTTGGNRARLIGSEFGAFFPVVPLTDTFGLSGSTQGIQVAEVQIVNGTGTAVWEVTMHDPVQIGRLDFSVHSAWTGFNVSNNVPAAPSQSSVAMSFAPTAPFPGVSTTDAGRARDFTAPIPRFVDLGTARNLFRINICQTNLLFPFVTTEGGFTTGLAVMNTSQDPFGTAVQTGTCTYNAYGRNAGAAYAPAAAVTPEAPQAFVASNEPGWTNFTGYVIAQCRFQYAHGFAFITDINVRNFAHGYLALIIPSLTDGSRPADPFPTAGAGSGEQLGN